ncbi:MAG: hypothetical protein IT211_11780 [Armatimonadetes bacterium]|nr:hypothetical protein [Armatimonadota bacterium]
MTPLQELTQAIKTALPAWEVVAKLSLDVDEFVASETLAGATVLLSIGQHEPHGEKREGGKFRKFRENYSIFLLANAAPLLTADDVYTAFTGLRDTLNGHYLTECGKLVEIGAGTPLYSAGIPEAQLTIMVY